MKTGKIIIALFLVAGGCFAVFGAGIDTTLPSSGGGTPGRNTAAQSILRVNTSAPADCGSNTTMTPTVPQLAMGILLNSSPSFSSCTITLPSWQGSTGIVQAWPGGALPLGAIIGFQIAGPQAKGAINVQPGTGGTLYTGSISNSGSGGISRFFQCQVTDVTPGAELATCY